MTYLSSSRVLIIVATLVLPVLANATATLSDTATKLELNQLKQQLLDAEAEVDKLKAENQLLESDIAQSKLEVSTLFDKVQKHDKSLAQTTK